MQYLPQIAFLIVLGVATGFISRRIGQIKYNINLGQELDRSDRPADRWRTMALMAIGQKKMFKRVIPAVLHLTIYVGFWVINLEVLEFIIDGIFGTHRIFAPFLGNFYSVAINIFEFLAVAVFLACVFFLTRRHVLKLDRFYGFSMKGWPTLDANLILVIEMLLMAAILTMNATDQLLQDREVAGYVQTGDFIFSKPLKPVFAGLSNQALVFTERFAWWFHIIGILGFAAYVTYSKHLHIGMAFPNTYYSNLQANGKMDNMPAVTSEVNSMLGIQHGNDNGETGEEDIPDRFGAKDVNDLYWTDIMGAYSCTECGRCTAECPANQTGKRLSPRAIMQATRDRAEELGEAKRKGQEDNKSLLDDYISREELNACTTCNACVEACPVNINPLNIILQMRRYISMEEAATPAQWNSMFNNIETSFSPWKFAPTDRFNWAEELKQQQEKASSENQ